MNSNANYRHLYRGLDAQTPLLDGSQRIYINLDNAASTPSFVRVQDAVDRFLEYYSSVHRGTGFKSQLSTHAYESARNIVLEFFGADPQEFVCVFGKNTTEAINKLARRFPFTSERDTVITTGMEHHSNDLPWRAVTRTLYAGLTTTGELDEEALYYLMEQNAENLALVAVTGASNVTGYINPIYRIAKKAHEIGAQIIVDCAQLAPHRSVDMRHLDDPEHLDYITISAHKMYAPFGAGALIGRRDTFERGDPDMMGGGTVEIVTLDNVAWAQPPERDEAGSPNTVGAVALAAAIRQLREVGMDAVASHEAELTSYALRRLSEISGVHIFGDRRADNTANRLGVIPFMLEGHDHFLTSAILSYEFGIGVRNGCFCAHPYILSLLGLSESQARHVREQMLSGYKGEMPGLVRASFGLYNTMEEIDILVDAVERIARNNYSGSYQQDTATGEYKPRNWNPDYESYFQY